MFYSQVGLYSTDRRLFACRGELPDEGLPRVVELPAEAFAVCRSVRAITRADHIARTDHISHLGGFAPPCWKLMPCERAGKLSAGGCDLACRGLTFVPPDCTTCILGAEEQDLNIAAVRQGISPLLTSRAPPFEEALD